MAVLAVIVGGVLVVSSFADMLNTLVATHTSRRKYWFTYGFELLPYDEARQASADLRRRYDAKVEWLIDELVAPRGFWGHAIGHRYARSYVISRDRD